MGRSGLKGDINIGWWLLVVSFTTVLREVGFRSRNDKKFRGMHASKFTPFQSWREALIYFIFFKFLRVRRKNVQTAGNCKASDSS